MEKSLIFNKLSCLFAKQPNSLIVVDIGPKLKIIDLELSGEIKVNAFKVIQLGHEKKEETIVESLKNFLSENNVQHKDAILIPSLSRIYTKRIQLPNVPEDELLEAAKWKIKDDLPFDLAKAVIDYKIVNRSSAPDGSKLLDLICIAAETEEINKQALLLKQAGLHCASVTFAVFGYAKLIEKYLKPEKGKHLGVLHVSEKNSYLAVYSEGLIVFFRSLPVAIDRFKESLSAELLTEKGKVRLSPEEVSDILYNYGIPTDGPALYKDKMAASQILAMLRPPLEMLAQEIKRSLAYYSSQFQGEINKILVCAEGLSIPNLDKFFSKELSLEVTEFVFAEKIRVSSGISANDVAQSYAGIGLGLGYRETINLLPAEFRTEKIEKFQKVSLRWVSFIAVLLLAVSFVFALTAVGAYQKRLDNALFQLNVLSEIKQAKDRINILDGFLGEIKNSEPRYARILEFISNASSRDLFLNSLSISSDSKGGMFSGYIKNKNDHDEATLTKFVGDLDNSVYFKDTIITKVTTGNVGGAETVNFEITFKLQ